MLTSVSFNVTPPDRGCRLSDTTGGLRTTPVKNEIGARLATPSWDSVLTQPIARGMMLPISSLYADAASRSAASMITMLSSRSTGWLPIGEARQGFSLVLGPFQVDQSV